MEIVEEKRSVFSGIALIFSVVFAFISIMEFIHIGLSEPIIFFFSSPGDAIFETTGLDHLMKGFISFVIFTLFLSAVIKLQKGTIDGFAFLLGAAILSFGVGILFTMEWIANIFNTLIIGISDPEVWEEFTLTDGIRLEEFLGIASIYILMLWKNKEKYIIY